MVARPTARVPLRGLARTSALGAIGALIASLALVERAHADVHHTAAESAVRADVVAATGFPAGLVFPQRWQSVTWPDACLGAPEPGEFCAQVLTNGFVIWVNAGEQYFRYHTDVTGENIRLAETRVGRPATFPLPEGAVSRPVDLVAPVAPPAPPVEPGPGEYLIQPGDTLFRIAMQHGTTVAALAEANNIANPDLIFAGALLRIP